MENNERTVLHLYERTRGRPRKKATLARNVHCCYGGCFNRAAHGVKLITFPKPCIAYRNSTIPRSYSHVDDCEKCSKCQKWVLACKRKDGRFDNLDCVKKDTYICIQHFV